MTEAITSPRAPQHPGRWKWFLALGGVLLVLGMTGVSVATLLQITSLLVFGPLLLASSIVQLLTFFFEQERKEGLLHFAAAGLEGALGFLVMVNPPERVADL